MSVETLTVITRHGATRASDQLVAEARRRLETIRRVLGRRALDMILPEWVTVTADVPIDALRQVTPVVPDPDPVDSPSAIERGRRHGRCGTDLWRRYVSRTGYADWQCVACSRRWHRATGRPRGRPRSEA